MPNELPYISAYYSSGKCSTLTETTTNCLSRAFAHVPSFTLLMLFYDAVVVYDFGVYFY